MKSMSVVQSYGGYRCKVGSFRSDCWRNVGNAAAASAVI